MSSEAEREEIIVVEDDPATLALMAGTLRKDFNVSEAMNVAKCVKLLENITPALLLTDVMLPDGNGIDLVKLVRENPRFKDTAVVVVTAHSSFDLMHLALESGADDFLAKPVRPTLLRTRVRLLMRSRDLLHMVQQKNEELERALSELYELHSVKLEPEQLKLALRLAKQLGRSMQGVLATVDGAYSKLEAALAGSAGGAEPLATTRNGLDALAHKLGQLAELGGLAGTEG